ncbi:MAG: hypothetical protein QF442_01605, partial [Candidatus Peribacteraceae bacterium]|nr:hypothetical protein [Candidatus Peribacteraceae bacterium]
MDFSNFFRRTVLSISACAMLFIPTTILAQDSFFDVFFEIEVENVECDKCKAIEIEIAKKEELIADIKADIEDVESELDATEDAFSEAEEILADAEAELAEMEDPQNYVESEGRRYDSSDNAAMKRRSAGLWGEYRAGNITAQEYSDEVGKPFDDPEVARELEKIKKEIIKDLNDEIKNMKDAIDDLSDRIDELNEEAAELTMELEDCLTDLEELLDALDDCRKRCAEGPVDPIKDYGLGEDRTFIDSFFDIFVDLFNPPPVIPGLGETLDTLVERTEDRDTDPPEVPIELVQLDLSGLLGPEINLELPPVICHLCDPILQQIIEFQSMLDLMLWEQEWADGLVELLYDDLGEARDLIDKAERDLDALNNPDSFAESEGRRMDSSDQAAMRSRNARLWADYRSGGMSAQQLSDEWAKPIDHPDVQRELDAIKDRMKDELEDAIDDAQDVIDEINEEIESVNDILVDLAGKIAAHEVILGHLHDQLADCERRCREPVEDNSLIIGL